VVLTQKLDIKLQQQFRWLTHFQICS